MEFCLFLINYLAQGSYNSEEALKKLYILNQELPENFSNLKNTFLELQKKLDSQDAEIERLKKGYDNHLTKKLISRFLKVFEYVGDLKNNNIEDKNLEVYEHTAVKHLLECARFLINIDIYETPIHMFQEYIYTKFWGSISSNSVNRGI